MSKIDRPFDEELKNLKEKLLEMGARAEEQITLAVRGLKDREEKMACQVLDREEAINCWPCASQWPRTSGSSPRP
jgi:hypothetical protein